MKLILFNASFASGVGINGFDFFLFKQRIILFVVPHSITVTILFRYLKAHTFPSSTLFPTDKPQSCNLSDDVIVLIHCYADRIIISNTTHYSSIHFTCVSILYIQIFAAKTNTYGVSFKNFSHAFEIKFKRNKCLDDCLHSSINCTIL